MRTRVEWAMVITLTLLVVASNFARGIQEATVEWEPITACYDTTLADYVAPVTWGYILGTIVGFSGVLRRRYRKLKPEAVHILDIS